jgi:transcriptional regulator with XRE-family HTH domain
MLRAARRLSQVDLAADAGMTPGAVSMIEARKANPTMDTLERIARAFGIDIPALLADRAPKS